MAREPGEQFENGEQVEIVDLEPTRTPKLSRHFSVPRHRAMTRRHIAIALRVAIVLSLLALSVLIVPNSWSLLDTDARNLFNSIVPPSLPADASMFYLDTVIPGMRVTLDRQTIQPSRIAVDAPLILRRGQHTITWGIVPFMTQSCVLSVPADKDDTCHFSYIDAPYGSHSIRVVLLNESLSTMPLALGSSLEQSIRQALQHISRSEPLARGELFLTNGGSEPAREPLIARLNFSLIAPDFSLITLNVPVESACPDFAAMLASAGIPCQLDGQTCIELCSLPWSARSYYMQNAPAKTIIDHPWFALAVVHVGWSYSTLDGKVVGSDLPSGLNFDTQVLLLRISWHTGWQIHILTGSELSHPLYATTAVPAGFASFSSLETEEILVNDNPACSTALVDALDDIASPPGVDNSHLYDLQLYAAPNPATGCLMKERNYKQLRVSSGTQTVTEYLVRFGVLLASNEGAHLALPALPYAGANALLIARQLQRFSPMSVILTLGNA